MTTGMVGLHMGALHPAEQALTLVLAFGPFVVLGVVISVRRRREAAAERTADSASQAEPLPAPEGQEPGQPPR